MARLVASLSVGAVLPLFYGLGFSIFDGILSNVIRGSWFGARKAPDAFSKGEPALAQCDAHA